MPEYFRKKNEAAYFAEPMIDTTTPASFKTGETVTDTAYYKDGAGAWTSLSITDTFTEIGSTGIYEIDLTAAEMNHDQIVIKMTSTAGADNLIVIWTRAVDVDDLVRSTTPANTLDVSATGEAGIDWANIGGATTAQNFTNTTISTVSTLSGHTAQTGDSYSIVNSGTFGNAQLVRSTTPANTLDVNVTGQAGIDLDNTVGTLAKTTDITGFNDIAATDVVSAGAITTSGGAVSTVTTVTNAVTVGTINANVITAASINAAAITAAKFATDAIDANALAATAVDEIRDGLLPTQNVAFNNIEFLFVAASDHVTPVTGATGTAVTRSIDGGAFGAATGTLAEVGNGIYQFDASAADMNGGIITFRFTATGGTPGAPDDRFLTIVTGGGV